MQPVEIKKPKTQSQTMLLKSISKQCRDARKQRGYSQSYVANKAGVSPAVISRLENISKTTKATLHFCKVVKIARVLNVKLVLLID